MCVVKQIEVPNVETRFFHDICECHPAIRQRYAEWKEPKAKPLLLTHRRNAPLRIPTQPPKAGRRKVESRTGTR
jgi:hypothetical protein